VAISDEDKGRITMAIAAAAWNEWVIELKGSAMLQFADEPATRALGEGDYVFIPASKRHRVESTNRQRSTIWLAAHFE
jgi:cupin 2 domain-containing protein